MIFAPELIIPNGVKDVSFYQRAFDAREMLRLTNEDESIHVIEFSIGGTIFHLHEVTDTHRFFPPAAHGGCTTCIGVFVEDVDEVMHRAIAAGAKEVNPAEDHDYGYRQGMVLDPFGHYWQIQKKI
ncbi:MAG: VOC family protein [Chitinophagaceae bacterium]|nr:MAG: VOC family protein [Chitinophagaceae bacterium]